MGLSLHWPLKLRAPLCDPLSQINGAKLLKAGAAAYLEKLVSWIRAEKKS
jgi:hypothetical protein